MVEYFFIALVAITWGGYPLLTRASGYPEAPAALLLTLVALVPILLGVFWHGRFERPSGPALGYLVAAGLMQGVGLVAFLRVASGRLEASVSMPIVDTSMIVVTTVGAILLFRESMTLQKLVGIALLVAGIVILRPSEH
jgi:drug/metabolite transporter (DMT)-like permease